MGELNALANDYKNKMDESDLCKAWNQLLENDALQNEQRQKYVEKLEGQHRIFHQLYAEEKKSENALAKQIENNSKIVYKNKMKMEKVTRDIEMVHAEIKRIHT